MFHYYFLFLLKNESSRVSQSVPLIHQNRTVKAKRQNGIAKPQNRERPLLPPIIIFDEIE